LADWNLLDAPVLLTRTFGYPGRIDSHECVWLTITQVEGNATMTLNDHLLGETENAPFEADVTSVLKPHNQLDIHFKGNQVGDVAMEVRATAYLKDVRVWRQDDKIHVAGTVAGTCDRNLELYVLIDRRHALYRTIRAGESFAAALEEEGVKVRVELINVATVWYAVELPSAKK